MCGVDGNGGLTVADVITFPKHHERFPGNGAREMMIAHILETGCTREAAEAWTDYTLADFWIRGFKVVPVDD